MPANAITFLLTGMIFGMSAGISPGPLLTLVISETLRHNIRAGIKVAVAPLATDAPIVLCTFFVLSRLADVKPLLGVISLLGGVFIAYVAWETITIRGVEADIDAVRPHSLKKGIVTNFLSPHPYMFWLAIGSPTLVKAADMNIIYCIMFISGFYACIVGSKIAVAVAVGKFRSFLQSRTYIYTIRFLGAVLIVFSALFIVDGLKLLGIIQT